MDPTLSFEIEADLALDEAEELVREALKSEGFGVLTKIDVKETLREKLDVDFKPFIILGACNPALAHRALLSEPRVGIMLPCNITIESSGDSVKISLVNPEAMLTIGEFGENPDLSRVAVDARQRMERVAEAIRINS